MSENAIHQPSEDQGSGRANNNEERKRYEGFEGMNYEQKRPPYNPQPISNGNRNNDNSTGKRRDEL